MTAPRTQLARSLVGPAGEHYVLFRLHQQGLLAAPAPPGTPVVDLLVLSPDGESIAATVQVKTRTTGKPLRWAMNQKHERLIDVRMFYAFVDLEVPDGVLPATYVVPSAVVAGALQASHQAWLATPGRAGRAHNDNPMRQLMDTYPEAPEGYPPGWLGAWRERWDLLTE